MKWVNKADMHHGLYYTAYLLQSNTSNCFYVFTKAATERKLSHSLSLKLDTFSFCYKIPFRFLMWPRETWGAFVFNFHRREERILHITWEKQVMSMKGENAVSSEEKKRQGGREKGIHYYRNTYQIEWIMVRGGWNQRVGETLDRE